jgi:hypothetical protein
MASPSDLAALGHLPHCVREDGNPTSPSTTTSSLEPNGNSPNPDQTGTPASPNPTARNIAFGMASIATELQQTPLTPSVETSS